jgi:hypothetical protein
MDSLEHSKVLIEYYDDDGELQGIESLWAVRMEGNRRRLDNTPFFAVEYAADDIVEVEERHGVDYVVGLVEASGHSCIQIIFFDVDQKPRYCDLLVELGCSYEGSHLPALISVDVPPEVSYEAAIKPVLVAGAEAGVLDFQEACLGQ